MGYITVQDVSNQLQIDITSGSTPSSSTVEDWIGYAEDEIDKEVGYSFTSSTATNIYIPTNGRSEVWVPSGYTPLISVDTVQINTGTDFDENLVTKTANSDYITVDNHLKFAPGNIIRKLDHGLKIGTITYGYATVPAIVNKLALNIVVKQFIKSTVENTNASLTQEIKIGPITLKNSSGEVTKYLMELTNDIDDLFSKVGTMKSYIG